MGPAHGAAGEPAAAGGVRRREQHARGGARAGDTQRHADGAVLRGPHARRRRARQLAHADA